jgi:hypothetical protein
LVGLLMKMDKSPMLGFVGTAASQSGTLFVSKITW